MGVRFADHLGALLLAAWHSLGVRGRREARGGLREASKPAPAQLDRAAARAAVSSHVARGRRPAAALIRRAVDDLWCRRGASSRQYDRIG